MTAVMLLAALFAGQCDPIWGCQPPRSIHAPVAPPLTYVAPPQPLAPIIYVQRYSIQHLGVDFVVNGYRAPGSKLITWDRNDMFNRRSYAAAISARDAEKAARDADKLSVVNERKPTAEPGPPPEPAPVLAAQDTKADIQNFGLDPTKIGKEGERFHVASDEAKRFVEGLKDPADGGGAMLHLTVIGEDAEREKVLNDLKSHPALAPYRGKLLIQDYKPGEWAVEPSLGFQAGTPSIVIEAGKTPDDPKGGKVIWRANNYQAGPEGLAEALRKANPDYRPNLDPGPTVPSKTPFVFDPENWPWIFVVGVVLFMLISLPTRKDR